MNIEYHRFRSIAKLDGSKILTVYTVGYTRLN